MTTKAALVRAVFAEPHDDAPRLVYADWLEEHGDEHDRTRAEFIRLQCEIAQIDEDDPGYDQLARRQSRLWNRNARRWRSGLGPALRDSPFVRGFPYPKVRRSYSPANFLKHAAGALGEAPSWQVEIRPGKPAETKRLAASPLLARIDSLRLDPDDSTAELLAAPSLRWLRALEVWGSLTGPVASALISNPGQGGLRELELMSGEGDEGINLLLGAAWPRLRQLELWQNRGLSRKRLSEAVQSSDFSALRSLTYFDPDDGSSRAVSPALGPLVGRLHRLEVWGDSVRPAELQGLLGPAQAGLLRHLVLCDTSLGDAGARWLAAAENLAGLRSLNLSESGIGPLGARALLQSPVLAGLTMLNLAGNPADEDPAIREALAERFPEGR
jgi:uncharacterized protein (TIGR02996 family)